MPVNAHPPALSGNAAAAFAALDRFIAAEERGDGAAVARMLSPRHTGYGTGVDEVALCFDDAIELISRMKDQSSLMRRRKFDLLFAEEVLPGLVIIMVSIALDIMFEADSLTMQMRTSYIWELDKGEWRLLHQHVSEPAHQQHAGESFPLQRLYERTQELERLVAERTGALERAMLELQMMANTDRLTGLPNRTHLDEILTAEYELLAAGNRHSVLAILDLDNFKEINDRHGHLVGDAVLQQVAALLRDSIRSTDRLGRWGGEEFLVVLPLADMDALTAIAARIRAKLQATEFGLDRSITVSGGFAWYRAGESLDSWLSRADSLLYEAKHGGRDRFIFDS